MYIFHSHIYHILISNFQLQRVLHPTIIDLADKQAVKVSIYGGNAINMVKLVLNGNYDAGAVITINQGEWNDFTIPLSQLGSPATLNEIVIQEFSGAAPSVIYIDDLGLI